MKRTAFYLSGFVFLAFVAVGTANATFTQCPSVGGAPNDPWPSCGYLLTINSDNSVTVTADTSLLLNIANDTLDPEDILLGVQNNSGRTQFGLNISGSLAAEPEFFDFSDADFPYTGGGVTFSNISALFDSGTVNFVGGLAADSSTWFGLEGSAQQDGQPVPITASAVPEPSTLLLLGSGMVGFAITRIRKFRKIA